MNKALLTVGLLALASSAHAAIPVEVTTLVADAQGVVDLAIPVGVAVVLFVIARRIVRRFI